MRRFEMGDPGALAGSETHQPRMRHLVGPLRGRRQHPLLGPLQPVLQAARLIALRPSLALGFKRFDNLGLEPGAQSLIAHRLGNQVIRQRARFGRIRRVVGVHVAADLIEGEVLGKGARRGGAGQAPRQAAVGQFTEPLAQGRQVEFVGEAGAPRLQQHREVRVLGGGGHQLLGLQATHPKRQALVEAALGQQQRPARALAKARAKETGLFQ